MKKLMVISLVLALAVTSVFAQGGKEETKKNEIKIALIVSSTIDDKGWCRV